MRTDLLSNERRLSKDAAGAQEHCKRQGFSVTVTRGRRPPIRIRILLQYCWRSARGRPSGSKTASKTSPMLSSGPLADSDLVCVAWGRGPFPQTSICCLTVPTLLWTWPYAHQTQCLSRASGCPKNFIVSPDRRPAIPSHRARFRRGSTLCRPRIASK